MRDDYNQPVKVKSDTEKDEQLQFVVGEFTRYEQFHRERFEQYAKIYKHWKNTPPKRSYSWQNQVCVPATVEAEQTISPRIFTAMFPDEAPLEVKIFGEATERQGRVIRDAIRHRFVITDVQGEAWPSIVQCTLFGTGYLETGWRVTKQWQIDPTTGERYYTTVSQTNYCRHVNIFEIFPHPYKVTVTDGLPLIRRRFADAEYIKKLADDKRIKLENLPKALNSECPIPNSSQFIVDEHGKFIETQARDKYEILEYWGPWDESYTQNGKVVTKKAVPYWCIIINRQVKILSMANPHNHQRAPIAKFKLFEDAHPSWFGVGTGVVGLPTQERLNKIVNQRLDNVDLVLNKQGFYNGNDPLVNVKSLQISMPGKWHKVSDVNNSIRWMDIPDVTRSSYEEEKIAKQDYRESTGAVEVLMPSDAPQHRTAMGINMLQGAAGTRFKPVLRKMEQDLIADVAFMFFSDMQQFMTAKEWITVMSDNGKEEPFVLTPEMLQAKVMFIPTGVTETIAKELQIGQLLRFKELTVQDPTVNRQEINRRIAELMGFKNIDKFLTPMTNPVMRPGGLAAADQMRIQQRLAEGASPEQIKAEMLGTPPAMPATMPTEERAAMMGAQ